MENKSNVSLHFLCINTFRLDFKRHYSLQHTECTQSVWGYIVCECSFSCLSPRWSHYSQMKLVNICCDGAIVLFHLFIFIWLFISLTSAADADENYYDLESIEFPSNYESPVAFDTTNIEATESGIDFTTYPEHHQMLKSGHPKAYSIGIAPFIKCDGRGEWRDINGVCRKRWGFHSYKPMRH